MKACHDSIVVRAAEAVGGMQVKLTQLEIYSEADLLCRH